MSDRASEGLFDPFERDYGGSAHCLQTICREPNCGGGGNRTKALNAVHSGKKANHGEWNFASERNHEHKTWDNAEAGRIHAYFFLAAISENAWNTSRLILQSLQNLVALIRPFGHLHSHFSHFGFLTFGLFTTPPPILAGQSTQLGLGRGRPSRP